MQIIKLLPFLFLIVLAQIQNPQTEIAEREEQIIEDLQVNWDGVLKCIQDAHPVAKNILALINAIKKKNYGKALELALKIIDEGSVLVKRCYNAFKSNEIVLQINWPAIGDCLLSIGGQVPGIASLVAAIVGQQYWLALSMIPGLIGPALDIFNRCKRMFN